MNTQYPPRAAHPVLYTGTRVCTVLRLLRGKEGATQGPLSALTRESLVEEVRTVVAWARVTCERCGAQGEGLESEFNPMWVCLRPKCVF